MPDLSIEIYYHCSSNDGFEMDVKGTKKTYRVQYGLTPFGECQRGWSCSCEAFKYGKGKECKHIKVAKGSGRFCGWSQFLDGDNVKQKKGVSVCPKCGKPAIAMKWAV